jgi:hypothetical protein
MLPREVFRYTGLPSRSAAPPLRLDALWRPDSRLSLDRQRSPQGVSAACIVTGERFSDRRFPRVPPLRMCPRQLGDSSAHSQGPHARRYALFRAPQSTRIRATARPDTGVTRDGCRASAGRSPGEGRPILLQRCPAPARALRRTVTSGSGRTSGRDQPRGSVCRQLSGTGTGSGKGSGRK